MEKNNREFNNMLQPGDVFFEYLREMKNEQSDDSDYNASFMTF